VIRLLSNCTFPKIIPFGVKFTLLPSIFFRKSIIENQKFFVINSEIKMEKYSARLLSPYVIGDCFNMKWQPLEVALTNVHG
jgi:hypothetical protein